MNFRFSIFDFRLNTHRILPSRSGCRVAALFTAALLFSTTPALAHESPVDHVERTMSMWIADGRFMLSYRLAISERSALLELHAMDTDRDGKISDAERDAYFLARARWLASQVKIEMDGVAVPLSPVGRVTLDPQFGQSYLFEGPADQFKPGKHTGRLVDDYARKYPGYYRYHEVDAKRGAAVHAEPPPVDPDSPDHPTIMNLKLSVDVPVMKH